MKGDGAKKMNQTHRSLVGNLFDLITTKLDIMYTVSLLSRFMSCPSQTRFGVKKRVFRYF